MVINHQILVRGLIFKLRLQLIWVMVKLIGEVYIIISLAKSGRDAVRVYSSK